MYIGNLMLFPLIQQSLTRQLQQSVHLRRQLKPLKTTNPLYSRQINLYKSLKQANYQHL